jgi:outer membrane protein OmpA-like peptidoglycan-associated protein
MVQSQYAKMGNPLALTPDLKNVPLEMYEARNAVEIAKSQKADTYAPDIYAKAESSLKMAENSLASKADRKQIVSGARQTVQFAEDARALSAQRQDAERIQNERDAAATTAAAKAKAEADARAAAEAKRQAELAAAKQEQMQAQADLAATRAKAEADAAASKAKAEQDALKAKEEAANAEALRSQQEAEKAQRDAAALRTQLLEQFSRVLETTDTPRGLVVNMGDVLFDTGKYNLKPEAREKLAKLSGIVLAHPGLHLAVEGHTDNVGSDEFNMKLSDQRANTVRDYLIQQGLAADSVTAEGLGKGMPAADNSTPTGRQKNRRVEIIVSGEVIGQKIGK